MLSGYIPMPWIDRPMSIRAIPFVTAARIAPRPKIVTASKTIGLRPKMSLMDPKTGWKTVLVSRKLVPDQKPSIAVP